MCMIWFYLTFEALFLLGIILSTFFGSSECFRDILRLLPILFNFVFALGLKGYWILKLALLFSLIADLFFLILNVPFLGIIFYICVQMCYRAYLTEEMDLKAIIGYLAIFLFGIHAKSLFLPVALIFYIALFLKNLHIAYKKSQKAPQFSMFLIGLIFLFLCDSFLGIKTLFKKSQEYVFIDVLEWAFYITSQLLIVLHLYKRSYNTFSA